MSDLTLLHQDDSVSYLACESHFVCNYDHGHAAGGQLGNHCENLASGFGV